MITVLSYDKKTLKKISLDKFKKFKNATWIDSENPSEKEMDLITQKIGINRADIIDCLDPSEKPRLQREKNYFFFILGVPLRKNEKHIITAPLGVFLGKNFVLTVHRFQTKAVDDFLNKGKLLLPIFKQGIERVLYNLLMIILKDFYAIIEEMEQNLERIETKVINSESEQLPHNILGLKKTLFYIRKTFIDNRDVITLIKERTLFKNRGLLYDLYIEFVQQVDMTEILRERLTVALEIYFSSVSNKLNVVMKSFTVIASLILLPTLIAGVYGMNFTFLPLRNHPYGFWIMIVIMFLSVLVMFLYFKRKNWV